MFEVDENIFDLHRGDSVPVNMQHLANEMVMEKLSVSLVNTSWAPSTRRLYQGWVVLWVSFCVALCAVCSVAGMPAGFVPLDYIVVGDVCHIDRACCHVGHYWLACSQ